MKKLIGISLVALISLTSVFAQQDAEYSMYMFNGLYLNPAYAGSKQCMSITGMYRHQWSGVDGAPRTVNASMHTPLRNDHYNLGITLANDHLGLTNMLSATPSFAYRIPVNSKMKLSFGVQAQFMYYAQNMNGGVAVDPTAYDDVFSINKRLFLPNVGAGLYLHGKKFYTGVSAPHLIPYKLEKGLGVDASANVSHQYNHYLFTLGGVVGKETNAVLWKPSVLIKYVKGMPNNIPDFDYNLSALIRQRLWLGASLRTGGSAYNSDGTKAVPYGLESFIGMVEFMANQQLRIGYAYDATLSQFRYYNKGTHELMVSYDFYRDSKRFVTPRYVTYF